MNWEKEPYISPAFGKALQYCEYFAQTQGFEVDLRPNYRNGSLLSTVHTLAHETNIDLLKTYCELLAHASKCGEMQGVLHRQPTMEEAEQMTYLFNTPMVPTPHDVKFTKLKPIELDISYNVTGIYDTDGVPETEDDSCGQVEEETSSVEV